MMFFVLAAVATHSFALFWPLFAAHFTSVTTMHPQLHHWPSNYVLPTCQHQDHLSVLEEYIQMIQALACFEASKNFHMPRVMVGT